MELTVWLGLLASALFISISPGPGAIFSISQGTQYGLRRALFSVIGLQLGLTSQILFLLFGLGVLIDQFPSIFIVIKVLGMIYLIILGIMQWFKRIEQISTPEEEIPVVFSPLKGLLQGFFVNLTNIKGTVFFLALIPLFINLTALKLSTCIIFISTLIGIDFLVMMGYVTLAEISKTLLSDPKKILWQNRLTGSTLILVGLIMGTT
ncbi:MAG: LysE family transporter [Thiotrichales bacterium]|jgi:homoserine/homoserine lactone efflux protein|nr:LysE family transporter [Thiotrichales bacterium]MBT3854510.1 LysE family transporter [Thiotrichales bacterium]MBT4654003.1 LysE family transporter [Thiotrichales bacterium]MBT5499189.1 LysE family transporter [Thiotrichales bacterium]MBT6771330.1 LysE family transporter [Thiotrichales bacterium]